MRGAVFFIAIVTALLWLGHFASSRAKGQTHDTPPPRVAYWEMRLGRSGKWAYICPNGVKSLRRCPVKISVYQLPAFVAGSVRILWGVER